MKTLAVVLERQMREKKRSLKELADFTQQLDVRSEMQKVRPERRGVPKRTLGNWRKGETKHPRRWEEVALVAAALELKTNEAAELLQAAGHATPAALRVGETRPDRLALLSRWQLDAPFQLAPDLDYFSGRRAELEKLKSALLRRRAVAVYGVQGMGGVGKTALVKRLAYMLAPHFPDGVLWGQLNRSDTMTILAQFAREYGRDVTEYRDVDSRSRAVQSLLANKQVLIILDNAQTSEQVRPLLPPSTGKPAVMITTRHDLAVSDEMALLELRPFPGDGMDALELFTRILGQQTVQRTRRALLELAALLGYLPLALAIASNRLKQTAPGTKREHAILEFLERVRDASARLDELTREDQSVRIAFDQSFAALPPSLQEFFVALGAFSGDDFDAQAAAYVADVSIEQAKTFLSQLVGLSLVETAREGRYTLHRLMRDYAQQQSGGLTQSVRMVEYYSRIVEQLPADDYSSVVIEDSNIQAVVQFACQQTLSRFVIQEAFKCRRYLASRGLFLQSTNLCKAAFVACPIDANEERLEIMLALGSIYYASGNSAEGKQWYEASLSLARQLNQFEAICDALNGCAICSVHEPDKVLALYEEALTLAQQIGYPRGTVRVLNNAGNVFLRSDFAKAETFFKQALKVAYEAQYYWAAIIVLGNLGDAAFLRGDWQVALERYREGEALCEKSGDQAHLSQVWCSFGRVYFAKGDLSQAEIYLEKSQTLAQTLELAENAARARANLCLVLWELGRKDQARSCFEQVCNFVSYEPKGEGRLEIDFCVGSFYLHLGNLTAAASIFQEIIASAGEFGYFADKGDALFGLAQIHARQKENDQAVFIAEKALAIFEKLGYYRTASVRTWIAQFSQHP